MHVQQTIDLAKVYQTEKKVLETKNGGEERKTDNESQIPAENKNDEEKATCPHESPEYQFALSTLQSAQTNSIAYKMHVRQTIDLAKV